MNGFDNAIAFFLTSMQIPVQTESVASEGCQCSPISSVIGNTCLALLHILVFLGFFVPGHGVARNSRHVYCMSVICSCHAPPSCGLHLQTTCSNIKLLKIMTEIAEH